MAPAIDIDEEFAGFDDAVVEDRMPGLEPNGKYLLALTKFKLFKARKAGLTLGIDYVVVESSDPKVVVGSSRNTRLTGLNDENKQKIQFGKIKALLAGMHNIDSGSKQKWTELLKRIAAEPKTRQGWLFGAETGPMTKAESGFSFMPVVFVAPPAGHASMPEAQAKKFQG